MLFITWFKKESLVFSFFELILLLLFGYKLWCSFEKKIQIYKTFKYGDSQKKEEKGQFDLLDEDCSIPFTLHPRKTKKICNIGFVQLVHNVQNKILHILIVMHDQLKLIICLKSKKKKKEEVKWEEFEDTFFSSIH